MTRPAVSGDPVRPPVTEPLPSQTDTQPVQRIADLADVKEALQRSTVKIETNAKGLAQVKVTVCAGETDAEMERLQRLALRIYDETQTALGRRAKFT